MVPTASLDTVGQRKMSCSCSESSLLKSVGTFQFRLNRAAVMDTARKDAHAFSHGSRT
jgi:hypothetical protein